jgi:rod shape-determining protein MreB
MAGIVYCRSVRAIGQYIRKQYNLLIGERRAEELKIALGSAVQVSEGPRKREVKGRDLIAGAPKTVMINEDEVRTALREPLEAIVSAVRDALEHASGASSGHHR